MKNLNLKKSLVALTSAALVSVFAVAIPSTANAAATCEKDYITVNGKFVDFEKCTGTDFRGSKYEIRMPAKFNGTMMLYSHGIRYNVDLPPIPLVAPTGLVRNYAPEIAPTEEVGELLLAQGFALAGAGVQVQGWNPTEQVYAALEVNTVARNKYSSINKVVAWGNSLGALSSQSMAEQYPGLFDAVGAMCLADSALAEITMAGDFLWGVKTFFDPSIKAVGYSAGNSRIHGNARRYWQGSYSYWINPSCDYCKSTSTNMACNLNSSRCIKGSSSAKRNFNDRSNVRCFNTIKHI